MELEWKDGSMSWFPLKEVKETNSVAVLLYAHDNSLMKQPVFAWWGPHTLKKRLIKLAQHQHRKYSYKFGIKIPTSVKDVPNLNKKNGNQLWKYAILKEVNAVWIAFEINHNGGNVTPSYNFVELMLILDVKIDFQRKACMARR